MTHEITNPVLLTETEARIITAALRNVQNMVTGDCTLPDVTDEFQKDFHSAMKKLANFNY